MNKIILHAASLLILGASLSLHAEEEQIPPPTAPFVERAPAHAAWKVTYASKQTPPPNMMGAGANGAVNPAGPSGPLPTTLLEVDVVKMDPNRREVYLWSNKQTTEHWIYHGLYLFNQLGMPDINVFAPGTGSMAIASMIPDYSKSDFPEFAWLSLDTYRNVVTYQQRKCYLFQSQPQPQAQLPKNPALMMMVKRAPLGGQQAWIDVKTLLPVALDDGMTLRTYTSFKELPPSELELPGTFAQGLHDWENPGSGR
jgi:hypothetical protein